MHYHNCKSHHSIMEYSSFIVVFLCFLIECHWVTLCNCSSSTHASGEILSHLHCGECKTNAPVSSSNSSIFPNCPLWYEVDNLTEPGIPKCKCRKEQLLASLKCESEHGGLLQFGHLISYNSSEEKYVVSVCPYSQFKGPNVIKEGYVRLPDNVSELNHYLCRMLNRTGPMCYQCITGFGPSLTSVQFQCTNCTKGTWYGALLYAVVEFVPITVFFLLILAFRIHITSAPMTCFIAYSQIVYILCIYNRADEKINFISSVVDSRLMQAGLVVYSAINLEFLHYIVPPFCISSKLHDIHIILLGYLSALYPLCLVFLSWVCVELHDRNFRPLVLLWKPFHRCCVRLRKGWNPKNDLIDAFASFFLLSYSKILYHSLLLIGCCRSIAFDKLGNRKEILYAKCFDPSILCKDMGHLKITIPSLIVLVLFNILPALLLVLYPIKSFRACLTKCRLDWIAITVFVEKFHGCYRDGLNGGSDMRSLSGLYFFLKLYALIYYLIPYIGNIMSFWTCDSLFLVITGFFIAYSQPYVKKYMTISDILLFINGTIICLLLSLPPFTIRASVIAFLLLLPALAFILIFVFITIFRICQKLSLCCHRCNCPCKLSRTEEEISRDQRLLSPVICSEASYGTCE